MVTGWDVSKTPGLSEGIYNALVEFALEVGVKDLVAAPSP